jgi:L-amino acid N-acyltransferase YncA
MKDERVTVRLAGISDYSVCLSLFKLLYHGDIGPGFKNVFKDYTREGVILLARTGGKLLGILVGSYNLDIDWEGRVARIDAVVVNENYRMRGIGKMLVKRFIEAAQKKNCKAVKSRINVANRASQKFHAELGFSRAGTYEYLLEL